MKKGCIFDLDGTLMNTIGTITGYLNVALREHGFAACSEEDVKYFVGNGAKLLVERALTAQGALTEDNFSRVFSTYNRVYNAAPNEGSAPYEGIEALLSALRERGVAVSSFFGDAVTVAHGGREGVPLKPSPAGVLELLAELGLSAADCFYIGDTGVDMQTGAAAGIETVGVLWGFRTREELEATGAKHIIAHPDELISLL